MGVEGVVAVAGGDGVGGIFLAAHGFGEPARQAVAGPGGHGHGAHGLAADKVGALVGGGAAHGLQLHAQIGGAALGVAAVQVHIRLIDAAVHQSGQDAAPGAAPAPDGVDELHFRVAAVEEVLGDAVVLVHPLAAQVVGEADDGVVLILGVDHGALGQEAVHHGLHVHQHQAQEIVGLLLGDAVGLVVAEHTVRYPGAVAHGVLAVVPDGVFAEALVVLDELDQGLRHLQIRGLRVVPEAVLVGALHLAGGPVGVEGQILGHHRGIGDVGAAAGGVVPAGEELAAAAGSGQGGVGLAQGIAQHSVVVQAASVAVEDHIAELGVADAVIAFVEEELDLPQAAGQALLREGDAVLDPGAEGVGQLHLRVAAGGDEGLHPVAGGEDVAAVGHDQVHQCVELVLAQGQAAGGGEGIDGGLRCDERGGAVAAHHLCEEAQTGLAGGEGFVSTGLEVLAGLGRRRLLRRGGLGGLYSRLGDGGLLGGLCRKGRLDQTRQEAQGQKTQDQSFHNCNSCRYYVNRIVTVFPTFVKLFVSFYAAIRKNNYKEVTKFEFLMTKFHTSS